MKPKILLGEPIEPQEQLTKPQTSPLESHSPTRMSTERRQPKPPPGP